jgi:DNA-binding CsgD family transcriptional regulator
LPIAGAAQSPFLGARALLVLSDLNKPSGIQPHVLEQTFGLSPAEARLAALMATGISPERAAERLGLARATVRNQLKAVFAKTETHRQSEIVALLSRL